MDSQRTYVVAAGALLDVADGQRWQAVICDNDSTLYLYLEGVQKYIAPGAHGVVVPLVGTQVGSVRWTAPPGTVQNALVQGQATFTFSTAALPASAPSSSQSPPYGQFPLNVGGTASTANTTTTFGPYTLPTGSQSVMVAWRRLTGTSQPTSVTVTDSTGTLIWGSITIGAQLGTLSDDLLIVPVSTTVDGVVLVKVIEPAATTHRFFTIALPQALATSTQLTGTDAVIPTSGPQTTIGTFTTAANESQVVHGPFAVPAGSQSITVSWSMSAAIALAIPQVVQVQDGNDAVVSGVTWGTLTDFTGGGGGANTVSSILQTPVNPTVSPSVYVQWTSGTASLFNVTVTASPLPVAVSAVIAGTGRAVSTGGVGGVARTLATAANVSGAINLPARTGFAWHIQTITASYGSTPNSFVSIDSGGATFWQGQVNTIQGAHYVFPDGGMNTGLGNLVNITIGAGGAGVVGVLSVVADLRNY